MALDHLQDHSDISLIKISKPYETVAVSSYQQRNYINSAAKISTILTPHELLNLPNKLKQRWGEKLKAWEILEL